MKTRVQKWGNSLALRIPKAFAVDLGLEADGEVEIGIKDGQLMIKPLRAGKIDLRKLLDGVSKKNIHAAVDVGPAVGREAW